jgi:hypothetical protein
MGGDARLLWACCLPTEHSSAAAFGEIFAASTGDVKLGAVFANDPNSWIANTRGFCSTKCTLDVGMPEIMRSRDHRPISPTYRCFPGELTPRCGYQQGRYE